MIGHHVRPRGGAAGDADAHASLTWGPGPHPRLFFSTRGGLGGLPEEVRKGKGLGPGSPPGPPSAACVYRVTEAIFCITLVQESSLLKVFARLSVCDHRPGSVSCCVILAKAPNLSEPHFLLSKDFDLKNKSVMICVVSSWVLTTRPTQS